MGFEYIKDERLVNSTVDFAMSKASQENSSSKREPVFTNIPEDTQIKYVPSYLLDDDQSPDDENIVYHVDKTILEYLFIQT